MVCYGDWASNHTFSVSPAPSDCPHLGTKGSVVRRCTAGPAEAVEMKGIPRPICWPAFMGVNQALHVQNCYAKAPLTLSVSREIFGAKKTASDRDELQIERYRFHEFRGPVQR